MRRLNKCFILCLGVLSCLLFNFFTTQKVEARTFNNGWLTCGANQTFTIYTSDGNKTLNCGSQSNIYNYSGNNLWWNRITFRLAPVNENNPWPQKVDETAYGTISFTFLFGSTNGILMPSGFVGRNVEILETEIEYDTATDETLGPEYACTTGGVSGSCRALDNPYTKITYIMKIRIPKQDAWDGTIDLTTNMSVLGSNFVYYYGMSQMRVGFYMPSAAELEQQKELEDRENIESQSSQISSDAESSKSDVEGGTTSLMNVIGGFANMLGGIRQTNCNLPAIEAYGFNIGRIDVCTYSPPSWISSIGNVIVSFIAVRLAIRIFRRIMGLVKGVGN